MFLSDLSVKRPVLAGVLGALLVVLGVLSYSNIPLREIPDVDRPVVSITTTYPGASADIVETRVTKVIEQQITGVDGIDAYSRARPGLKQIEETSLDPYASLRSLYQQSRRDAILNGATSFEDLPSFDDGTDGEFESFDNDSPPPQ